MPNETRNYVPKLLAVRNILAEPERFGLKLDKFDNRPYFVAVSTGKHMDIDVAAKLAGMSLDEFKALNPAFNRPIYAHKPGRQLLVPASKAELFEKIWPNTASPCCPGRCTPPNPVTISTNWPSATVRAWSACAMSMAWPATAWPPASRCCWPREQPDRQPGAGRAEY